MGATAAEGRDSRRRDGVTTVVIPCDSAQVPNVAIRSRPRARGATVGTLCLN